MRKRYIVHTVSQHGEMFVANGKPAVYDTIEDARNVANFIAVREGPKCQVWIQEVSMERVQ